MASELINERFLAGGSRVSGERSKKKGGRGAALAQGNQTDIIPLFEWASETTAALRLVCGADISDKRSKGRAVRKRRPNFLRA